VSGPQAVSALRSWPRAIGRGFSEWKTAGVLFSVNLLVAALMVAPAIRPLVEHFGHAPLAVGKPLLSYQLLLRLPSVFRNGGGPSLLMPLLLLGVLQLFLVGGVVWRTWTVDPFRLGEFLGESGRLFGRNVRLFFWSMLLLLLLAAVVGGTAALLHRLHRDSLFTVGTDAWIFGRPFTVWSVGHLAFTLLCLGLWRLSLEAARVLVFRDDLRQTRRAAWRGFRLTLRSPVSLALFVLLGVTATTAVFLIARVRASLPEGRTELAVLAFLVGQVAVWVGLTFQISGVSFAAQLVQRAAPAGSVVPEVAPSETGAEPAEGEQPAEAPATAAAAAVEAERPQEPTSEGVLPEL
jgi:hypothetical protein